MELMSAPCPVCGWPGGFHDHDNKEGQHAQHEVPQEEVLEPGWTKTAHEEVVAKQKAEAAEREAQIEAEYAKEREEVSDGHHTFKELYRYRLLYNAALFNEWSKLGLHDVHKSRFHHDGTVPFGDPKWFIVVAELPTGQISNHYRLDDGWELFDIPERDLPNVYDGHTPAEVAERLTLFLCLY